MSTSAEKLSSEQMTHALNLAILLRHVHLYAVEIEVEARHLVETLKRFIRPLRKLEAKAKTAN
jgi:hypothetical protein